MISVDSPEMHRIPMTNLESSFRKFIPKVHLEGQRRNLKYWVILRLKSKIVIVNERPFSLDDLE